MDRRTLAKITRMLQGTADLGTETLADGLARYRKVRVGRVLGHSSQTMTEYYAHAGADDVRDLVDRTEAAIAGGGDDE